MSINVPSTATERVLLLQLRSFRLYVNKGKVLFQFVEINCRMYPRVQRPHERAQEFFPPPPNTVLGLIQSSEPPSTTFCLLWTYLRATSAAKSLVVMDPPSYNPSQKPSGLWHPAGLSSPRNLRPQFLELRFEFSLAPPQPDRWISNVSSPLFSQLVAIFSYFRLTSLIPPPLLCWNQDYRSGATKWGAGLPSGWLTSCLSWAAQAWKLAVPSPLRPEPVYMTYGVWAPPLPIPLRVQFSDKQKHIQALASHFTLCALAGGNAFLEPLA